MHMPYCYSTYPFISFHYQSNDKSNLSSRHVYFHPSSVAQFHFLSFQDNVDSCNNTFPPATIITRQCPNTSFFFSYTIIQCIQGSTMTLFSLTILITCYQTIPFCKPSSFVSFTFVNHFRTLSVVNDRKSL